MKSVSELKAPFVSNDARIFNIVLTAYRRRLREMTAEKNGTRTGRRNRRNIFADSSRPRFWLSRHVGTATMRSSSHIPIHTSFIYTHTHDVIKQPTHGSIILQQEPIKRFPAYCIQRALNDKLYYIIYIHITHNIIYYYGNVAGYIYRYRGYGI